ncbi:EboA domain-containing protein [Pseudactinotalea sp. HY158]|uniref:EboA domain-containing protein n=1 Tax=Pseudactinotalea sp. HY158 TaxID=2654547 RepID=UPI001E6114AD|nr:EboA domain-containing protein [Pseudactinotalea sp. HY158]
MTQRARAALDGRLTPAAADRLTEMTAAIAADPAAIGRLFPAAAREVARGPLDEADPTGITGPTLDDAVRAVLLETLASAQPDEQRAAEVAALYRYGDGDEKRAILRSLPALDVGEGARALVTDALRTNDLRLVGAAMGAWAGEHLDDDAWRQGVLKCLFIGVPLAAVQRLRERADAELARMVAAFGHERCAAGRPIPPDSRLVLDHFPEVAARFPDVAAALPTVPAP